MADDTQELRFHIVSDADNTGFDKARDGSSRFIKSTQDGTEAIKKNSDATDDAAQADKKGAEEVDGLDLKKRELLESTRALTREMPILGEIMRNVYSPVTFSIFAIIGALEIWIERNRTLTEALGGVELPDLTKGIDDAQKIAIAYDGIAKAVKAANDEFNSSAAAFERQEKAVSAQLTATKQLISAQKEKAIADLDLQRAGGQITPAQYEARKNIVEQGYNDKTTQAEIDARNADLAAKKAEAAGLADEARNKAAAASAVKLPSDDKEAQAQADAFKKMADARQKQADDASAEAEKQRQIASDQYSDYAADRARGAVNALVTNARYGGDVEPADAAKMQEDAAKQAQSQADDASRAAAEIEQKIEDRKKLREAAEKAATDSTQANLGLQGEDDPNKVGSTAWKNAQDKAAQKTRDDASGETRFTGDINNANKDLEEMAKLQGKHDPESTAKAKQILADMLSALQDAMSLINTMASSGEDVSKLRITLAALARRVAVVEAQSRQTPYTGQ